MGYDPKPYQFPKDFESPYAGMFVVAERMEVSWYYDNEHHVLWCSGGYSYGVWWDMNFPDLSRPLFEPGYTTKPIEWSEEARNNIQQLVCPD